MSENALEMSGVIKRFGRKTVLDGFSISVPKGAVYALLGNNGAGKSTSIKIMTGQLLADSGSVSVLGMDPVKDAIALRRKLGYVAETERLFDFLTPPELFAYLGYFFRDWDDERAEELLKRFKLPSDAKIGSFSRGMYAKTALITVMARRPQLVILDDPSLGLDTVSRNDFLTQLIESIQEYEHTILLSSHLISEIEGLCDYAGILKEGRLVCSQSTDSLKARYRKFPLKSGDLPVLSGEVGRLHCGAEHFAVIDRNRKDSASGGEAMTLEEIFLALTT